MAEKGRRILAAHPDMSSDKLSYAIVKDIGEPGAFDEAIKSNPHFEGVVHCASPFHFDIQDVKKDLLDFAVNGTVNVMWAIKAHAPSVRRVVVTSSFAAMLNMKNHPDTYTENHWNPVSYEEAASNPADGYRGSKTFAEKAAWKFVEDEKPNFTLATINPPLVFGPIVHYLNSLDRINTSNARFRDMILGKMHSKLAATGTFYWVDVHDVALAHVRALETESAAGHRFITSGSTFTNAQIANIIKTKFPELSTKLPESCDSDLPEGLYDIDTSKARQILNIEFRCWISAWRAPSSRF
ncbi:methylglyoxal reductase (NADPH-dependent) gre2 [Fusarium torreyae]|uniref:Methylglyoxal reductase (NADPH-dependent) gre2 n=1 Tax=Fusarium torreyae TaxID=1237075 RepID=A0A9W8RLQ1_9HYPO|nr:methylglyoxal reductase (NADPH-dependent) gre2 [Fusarium torreyae]